MFRLVYAQLVGELPEQLREGVWLLIAYNPLRPHATTDRSYILNYSINWSVTGIESSFKSYPYEAALRHFT